MTNKVIVYSTPNCSQCEATGMLLGRYEIPFEKIDVSEDWRKINEFKAKGYMSFPIVIAGESEWSGFRPDLIKKYRAVLDKEAQGK